MPGAVYLYIVRMVVVVLRPQHFWYGENRNDFLTIFFLLESVIYKTRMRKVCCILTKETAAKLLNDNVLKKKRQGNDGPMKGEILYHRGSIRY